VFEFGGKFYELVHALFNYGVRISLIREIS
jgi:hypothetical protein